MRVLLDTSAYSAMKRGHDGVAAILRRSDQVIFSSVVAGELMYGFRSGNRFEVNRRELMEFFDSPWVQILPVTLVTADRFGLIHAAQRRKGRPIPTNDIWIAAHVLESGADLVTSDPHFGVIDGLACIDPEQWT